ncbi:OmpA/MotB domain protein [Cyclobacterium amurskyense]|uniref:OmpA/MotB domain protein n=2 Tax=Cyclobacterium amurskyense TaxID=320787 RepID=A0A0H4PXD2_9BACT|nr:OmpA/MotB domain protein [Cyclobacterium amurskyense]|tara:strand:- start:23105 stop:24520 length:1416 start_codon:yes stop_codon:yes gene_type:complete
MIKTFVTFLRASTVLVFALFAYHNSMGQSSGLKRVFSLEYDEQHPIIAPDGSLFFTLAFHPDNIGGKSDPGDVWFAPEEDGVFKLPQSIAELSTPFYDLLIGFIDSDTALVYHANLNREQVIIRYFWDGGSWNRDEVVQIPGLKTKGDYFSASLDPGGSFMVMSMDSYGSYGNEDLYISKRNGNTWSRPINLGASINTASQELSPAIGFNGDSLYFSTNASDNEKSIEIYFSMRLDESWRKWSNPKLLKLSEMAGMDMYYFPASENERFFFTNTQTSDDFGNIYYNGVASLKIEEVPSKKEENLENKMEIRSFENANVIKNLYANENVLKSSIEPTLGKTIVGDLKENLATLAVGEGLVLEGLLFQRASVDLVNDKESLNTLDELATYLNDNPEKVISIEGHTDSYGNENVNMRLSLARANKIKELLIERGVQKDRLFTKGWGGKKPIATNSNVAGRMKNRRVEIIFLLNK